jgi:phage gp37-like protein
MYDISDIEDAIITAVAGTKSVQLRTVKTYGGELDEKDLARLTAPLPAVYVAYGGSRYAAHGAVKSEIIRFVLLVCDKSLRSEPEARRGGDDNPGAYNMLAAVRDALCGRQLGLGIAPLELIAEELVAIANGVSIYGAEYETAQRHQYTGA